MTALSEISLSPAPRPLGKSGIMVSPIAWGMWRFGRSGLDEGQRLIEAAKAAGVTLYDTADIYGFNGTSGFGDAEALLGRIFAASPGLRDRMTPADQGRDHPARPL